MLKTGTCICPKCGRVFTDAYYYSGSANIGVNLKRSPGGFFVEAKTGSLPVKLHACPRNAHGLPQEITVLVQTSNGRQEHRLTRSCPKCEESTALYPGYGQVPTFVVALSGKPSAGKTCWLRAITRMDTLAALKKAGFPFTADPSQVHGDTGVREATPVDSLGATRYFTIRQEDGTPVAGVLFRDVAGEVLKGSNMVDDRNISHRRILSTQGDTYGGPDAFLLFLDPTSQEDNQAEEETINTLRAMSSLTDRPVGVVLTHADRLMARQGAALNRRTFPANGSCAPGALVPRVALESTLVRRMGGVGAFLMAQNPRTAGFLVKSCENVGAMDSYVNPINVMDPFIWVLHQLKLFPLA